MADDDIEIIEGTGDEPSGVSIFGNHPDSFGIDSDDPNFVQSPYDARTAENEATTEAQFLENAFGYTWAFDDRIGDFIVSGKDVAVVTELDCFAEWVVNLLATERRTCPSYSEDFGIDTDLIYSSGHGSPLMTSVLKQEIKEALSVHNRFLALEDCTVTQDGDTATVTLDIRTTAGQVQVTSNLVGADDGN